MKKYLLYLLFGLFCMPIMAQKELRFRNFTISDGLSQSSVTTIVQDNLNALWIGTQDGLNRYDGKSFEIFTSDITEGLESEYIQCSAIDDKGNLWFGTNNGLTKHDLYTETFQTYFIQAEGAYQIESISLAPSGEIWLTTAENGVFIFNPKTKKFSKVKGIGSRKTNGVLVMSAELVAISTLDQGVLLYNPKTQKTTQFKSVPEVNKMIQTGDDKLLLATKQGVFTINTRTKALNEEFTELAARTGQLNAVDIFQTHDGWLIATRSNGLYVLRDHGQFDHYSEDIFQKTALLSDELNLLYRDNSGSFWLGSQRGISFFDPSSKGFLGVGPSGNEASGIPTPIVWCFAESAKGNYMYVGTSKAVSRYDKQKGEFRQFYRESKSGKNADETTILSIEPINDQLILLACVDGLFELSIRDDGYTYKRLKYESPQMDAKHDRAYSILKLKQNTYLIATKGGALIYDRATQKIQAFEHDPRRPNETISKGICRLAYKDRKGRVWLSTSTGGINLLEEREDGYMISPYVYNRELFKLSQDYITTIYDDKNGVFWFGTLGSGLIRWDERAKKGSAYNKAHGLPNDVIYGILADKSGDLWLSTNKGLCAFNPATGATKNYTEINGLMSNEFNLGAFYKSSTGTLYFGGIYGYNYFNPENLEQVEQDIQIVFTKFKLENEWLKPNDKGSPLTQPIFLTKEIELSYVNRSFTLKFQPSTLANSSLVNYKYLLEGSDQGEILIGSNDEIRFDALAPGEYRLILYARYGEGEWNSVPATMDIIITPPFWQTWWFWMIFIVAGLIAVRLFIRQRIDAAARERIKLEMKIRERTREIQTQNEKIERQKVKIEKERNKVVEQQKLLQIEKDKTEKLLRNIIPESTAEELKKKGKARARAYKTVSVLFTDFVGFTKISDRLNPTELVKKLDVYFTEFDKIIVRNNLEKIKTIGDAYMCAGGVPVRNSSNPIDTCLAAVQIQDYMLRRKNEAIASGVEFWELRLGINTGEVTAGVIGSERLAFDIWGATVNQAQRMEMLSEPGKVTITGATFEHIEPYFDCTFKGKAQSKSRGLIDMYVVNGIKPELSVGGEGVFPNQRFKQIVDLHLFSSINYYKAERHIMRVLEQQLSKQLHYHSIAHTKDVVKAIERLALLENVTDEGLFLLKSAATYHDAGFIEQYDKNEPIGARLAQEILPKYGYTQKHIDRIKELIFVTSIPHKPTNNLEEIMCDADLDYLGRDDFHDIADKLRRELKEHGKIKSDRQWDEIQVGFLRSHRYFTETAKATRDAKKAMNLQEVIDRLERNNYAD